MIERLNLDPRKTMHFNVSRDAYDYMRAACFKKNITMQELFEEICQMMTTDHPAIMAIVDNLSERNFAARVERVKISDSDLIFSIIERDNPLMKRRDNLESER